MHSERIELKIPREVQEKVGRKKRLREGKMQSMAGTNNSTALLNDNTDDNPTLDNNLTKMSQSDREREREELIMAERNHSS
jgi:hypothetical protein